jgi:hypothetical protein
MGCKRNHPPRATPPIAGAAEAKVLDFDQIHQNAELLCDVPGWHGSARRRATAFGHAHSDGDVDQFGGDRDASRS